MPLTLFLVLTNAESQTLVTSPLPDPVVSLQREGLGWNHTQDSEQHQGALPQEENLLT